VRGEMSTLKKSEHTHHVLVVEDDPAGRYSITIALEKKQMEVIVAEDGVEALTWLKANEFCVVILDLVLPKVDGYGVIRYILDNKPDVPIIVVTGLKADELSGVDRRVVVNVLFKPFSASELADRVIETCESRQSQRDGA
jgi:DNA-binding response OmpR family regulator